MRRVVAGLLLSASWLPQAHAWNGHAAKPNPTPARASISGIVTHVSDGDSLWLRPSAGAPLQVRLAGIDAPEICQRGGAASRDALSAMALRRDATLHTVGHDVHGRTLGVLHVGTLDVNRRLVEEGHAWSPRFQRVPGPYAAEERRAMAQGRGVHAGGKAELPGAFRKRHGRCTR